MNSWRLFRWVLVRGIASGVVLGSLYAATIYSPATLNGYIGLCFLSFIVGGLMGGGLGGMLGVLDGLVLVVLTRFFSSPIRSKRLYRWSSLLLTTISTVVGCVFAVHIVFDDLIFVLVPVTITATIASAYFVWRLPDALASTGGKARPANAVLFYIEK